MGCASVKEEKGGKRRERSGGSSNDSARKPEAARPVVEDIPGSCSSSSEAAHFFTAIPGLVSSPQVQKVGDEQHPRHLSSRESFIQSWLSEVVTESTECGGTASRGTTSTTNLFDVIVPSGGVFTQPPQHPGSTNSGCKNPLEPVGESAGGSSSALHRSLLREAELMGLGGSQSKHGASNYSRKQKVEE